MRRASTWALALLALGMVAGCDAETAPGTEAETSDLREADPLVRNPRDRGACEDEALGDFRKADRMNATLVPMAAVVARGLELVPNDGMVSVESAKWGAFRGCIPADHLDEVGQERHDRHDRRTGFDHVRFYRNLAFELAAKGF